MLEASKLQLIPHPPTHTHILVQKNRNNLEKVKENKQTQKM